MKTTQYTLSDGHTYILNDDLSDGSGNSVIKEQLDTIRVLWLKNVMVMQSNLDLQYVVDGIEND
jgi:hypothetical protein